MPKMYHTMCPNCAEKMTDLFWVDPIEGTERGGRCKLCFAACRVQQYAVERKKKRPPRQQTGGGERQKAGG